MPTSERLPSREEAWQLLCRYTEKEPLRKHALAVEASMRHYARLLGEDEELWGQTGLLHDFDYERYPTLGDHPNKGCEHLRSLGYPEWVMRAIQAHALTRNSSSAPTSNRCEIEAACLR